MAGARAAGARCAVTVTLRVAKRADDAWLATWLPAAASSLGYALDGHAAERLIIQRDGERAGVAISRPHHDDAAIIELIATPPEHARRGAGMEAAALLETRLRRRGVRTIYAPAPAVHGIAMYFWIRLGYRPLLRGAWPCEREGVAWLIRSFVNAKPPNDANGGR
jgi:GNAT superfamily N-acetyltransferase